MSPVQPFQMVECPACGAPLSTAGEGPAACPACGAPLSSPESDGLAPLEPAVANRLRALLAEKNEQLHAAGARNAEDAFNLGCWMSAFVILAMGLFVYWISEGEWILVMIVLISGTLVATGIATLLSLQAKRGTMRRAFDETVAPELTEWLRTHPVGADQFQRVVDETLGEESPLRIHLAAGRILPAHPSPESKP